MTEKIMLSSEYNPKIPFKFVEYLYHDFDYKQSYSRLKKLYKGDISITPENKTEEMFSIFNKMVHQQMVIDDAQASFDYVVSYFNSVSELNLDSSQKQELSHLLIKANELLTFSSFEGLLVRCLSVFEQYELCQEISLTIVNIPLFVHKSFPFAFRKGDIKKMIFDKSLIKETLIEVYERTNSLNKQYPLISTESLVNEIISCEAFLKKNYYILHLYLLGSYAKNEQTSFSDVDIYCELSRNGKFINNISHEIKTYLSNRLNRPFDVVVNDLMFNENSFAVELFNNNLKVF